jgi:hypothetical protein
MLAYCDYIITIIKTNLLPHDDLAHIDTVGPINYDLGPNGEFLGTAKTLEVTDMNGKRYLITVEEL